MTYEIYRYIFIGGAILSGIMLVVTVIAFFALKIPTVIGDLTGSNARKAIEKIRDQNEHTKDSGRPLNERSELTGKMTRTGRIAPSGAASTIASNAITTQQLGASGKAAETTVLGGAETTVLGNSTNANETTVSNGGASAAVAEATVPNSDALPFVIEYEITFIHTDEII